MEDKGEGESDLMHDLNQFHWNVGALLIPPILSLMRMGFDFGDITEAPA